MKQKLLALCAVLLIFLSVFSIFKVKNVSYAAQKNNAEEELSSSVEDEIERLDTSALQNYFDKITSEERGFFQSAEIKNLIKEIASGSFKGELSDVLNVVIKAVSKDFLGFMPSLISIIIICILYGVLSGLNSGFLDKSTNKIIFFACYGTILIILLNEIVLIVELTVTAANRIKTLMYAVFPIMLTLMTALGGVSGAGLIRPLMTAAATTVVSLIESFVIPCFTASIIFAVVGNLSPQVKLEKLGKTFKNLAEWMLKLVFGGFLALLTAKGIVGRTVDGIGVNATKFALSSYVPILGSYLSEGFDVVMASCVLIKNALGVTGLLLMLATLLFPIVKIAAFSLSLRFVAALVEPMSDSKMADFLTSVSKSVTLLISSLCGLAFMFFALTAVVVTSCNLGVI